jgi:hypothetical protein
MQDTQEGNYTCGRAGGQWRGRRVRFRDLRGDGGWGMEVFTRSNGVSGDLERWGSRKTKVLTYARAPHDVGHASHVRE